MKLVPTEDDITGALDRIRNELHRDVSSLSQIEAVGVNARAVLSELEELHTRLKYFGTTFQTKADCIYDSRELLAFDGREFIHVAYLALLCRPPDPHGMDSYLHLLRAGRDKAWILGRIRWSAEGRRVNVKVRELWARYMLSRVLLLPFVGWVLRFLFAIVNLPNETRRTRIQIMALSARLETHHLDAVKYIAAASSLIRALDRQIALMEASNSSAST